MKGYILSEDDFKSAFEILTEKSGTVLAIRKNENKAKTVRSSPDQTPDKKIIRKSNEPEPFESGERRSRDAKSPTKINKLKELRKRLSKKRRKLEFE